MPFEFAPAIEPVLSCDGQLRFRQENGRVLSTQALQLIFCGLLQPLDAGTRGQGTRHATPSLQEPGVRVAAGRKKAKTVAGNRWVQPFTRTVGFLESVTTIPRGAAVVLIGRATGVAVDAARPGTQQSSGRACKLTSMT